MNLTFAFQSVQKQKLLKEGDETDQQQYYSSGFSFIQHFIHMIILLMKKKTFTNKKNDIIDYDDQ